MKHLYLILSVLIFKWRYGINPKFKSIWIGTGALRQLYLKYHRPIFRCSEEDVTLAFMKHLNYKQDDGEYLFKINLDNKFPEEFNSKESKDALDQYDVLVQ